MAGNEHIGEEDFSAVDKHIDDILMALDVNLVTIDKRTRGHLRKIERALMAELDERKAAEAEVRKHNLSVASISKLSGVSHATFYNKPVLSQFVNAVRHETDSRTNTSVSEVLRQRVAELQEQINMMNQQAALMVQLQRENDILRQRLRVYEVTEKGGEPAADSKGEILPFKP